MGFHVYRGPTASGVLKRPTASLVAGGPAYEYLDATAEPGREYYYGLDAVDSRESNHWTGP